MAGDVLFISDLHLSQLRPGKLVLFRELLQAAPRRAASLYILGDLFDFLANDEDDRQPVPQVFAAISDAVNSGLAVYFMQGNREQMVGSAITARSGMGLISDPFLLELDDLRVVLSHGDMLCTSDTGYMSFRRFVSRHWVQFIGRRLPLAVMHLLFSSYKNKIKPKSGYSVQMDVDQTAVTAMMRQHNAQVMVHGHIHRQGVHAHSVAGNTVLRHVLGDWLVGDSVLAFREDGFQQYRVRDWLDS